MSWNKELQLQQLDKLLQRLRTDAIQKPQGGWLKLIRTTIGMGTRVLGQRTGVTQSRVTAVEQSEVDGTVTLATLKKMANGLDCELIYFLLPKHKSLAEFRSKHAHAKALALDNYAEQQMALEKQGTSKEFKDGSIERLKEDFLKDWPRDFWDAVNENK